MLNNPLLYNDKSGEFFFLAVAIGAAIGAITQALKPGANFGSILGGALIGAAGGMIGAGVGSVVAGGGFFSSAAISSSMGFWGGVASGFAGGFAGGFVGGAGTAWLNGANFGSGLGTGLRNGILGGITGGLVKGVTNGFKALAKGDSFWKGANKGLATSNVNGPSANTLNKGVRPTATVEGVSDELLEWDPEHKIWYNPSTNLPRTATFSIMVKSTDWNRTWLHTFRDISKYGSQISTAGHGLIVTGAGAEIGVPIATIGDGMSLVGGVGEAYFSTNVYAESAKLTGWQFAERFGKNLIKRIPGSTSQQRLLFRSYQALYLNMVQSDL